MNDAELAKQLRIKLLDEHGRPRKITSVVIGGKEWPCLDEEAVVKLVRKIQETTAEQVEISVRSVKMVDEEIHSDSTVGALCSVVHLSWIKNDLRDKQRDEAQEAGTTTNMENARAWQEWVRIEIKKPEYWGAAKNLLEYGSIMKATNTIFEKMRGMNQHAAGRGEPQPFRTLEKSTVYDFLRDLHAEMKQINNP